MVGFQDQEAIRCRCPKCGQETPVRGPRHLQMTVIRCCLCEGIFALTDAEIAADNGDARYVEGEWKPSRERREA
jgi:hypothetical protein